METATAAKQPLVTSTQFEEKIVVKYIEYNDHEEETWRNYYMFDRKPKLMKQFAVLDKFMEVFDLESDRFELTMHRKIRDNSLKVLQKEIHSSKGDYKGSYFYSFSGTDLPHYRQIVALLKKHIPDGKRCSKKNIKAMLQIDDVYQEIECLFYKLFGDYKEEYGPAIRMHDSEESDTSDSDEYESDSDEYDESDTSFDSDEYAGIMN